MPLEKSGSAGSLHDNIKKLMGEGKSRSQALAIAYDIQKNAKQDTSMETNNYGFLNRPKPNNQAGAANPLGFVYGGVENQYPFGG